MKILHPSTEMTDEERARQMWEVHPKDLDRFGMSRQEFYLAHLNASKGRHVAFTSTKAGGTYGKRRKAKPVAMKTVTSLMSGKPVEIPADTPLCCDPSSETYWSM